MNDQLPAVGGAVDAPVQTDARPALPPLPVTPFDKLADAIASVMQEIEPVEKRGENAFQHYKFPRMQDVLQELTPLMSRHGIVIMQSEVERGFMDKGGSIYATYDFTVMHKSGQVWSERQRQTGVSRTRDSKGGFDDKSLNKCHTAARKFFLMSLFQIPTGDDPDADKNRRRERFGNRPEKINTPQQEPDPAHIIESSKPESIRVRDGMQWQDWSKALLMMINASPTAELVELWLQKNKEQLGELLLAIPGHHQFVVREANKRIRKLRGSDAA